MDRTRKGEGADEGIGRRFMRETSYAPGKLDDYTLDWSSLPPPYKDYASPITVVSLPRSIEGEPGDIWEVFERRGSLRDYATEATLPLRTLSALLWATQGITRTEGTTHLRTTPSAGALYPIETYLYCRAVDGLEKGFYHYRPHTFDLEFLIRGDFSRRLASAALSQSMAAEAQVTFVWSALVKRSVWKYRERAYRYVFVDVGHVAQNLYLAGAASGLGVCAIGAFYDDEMNKLIGLDGIEETVIYLACVGVPVKGSER